MFWLFVLFIVAPLLELWVIIQVAQVIGGWETIALLIIESAIGAYLLKHQFVQLGVVSAVQTAAVGAAAGGAAAVKSAAIATISGALTATGADATTVQAAVSAVTTAVDAAVAAAGGDPAAAATAAVTAAVTAAGQNATAGMARAGGELAAYLKNLVVANGAKRVVVVNVPDISKTPFGVSQAQSTRSLIELMSYTFNLYLTDGLKDVPEVLIVDSYQYLRDLAADPAAFGVTTVTATACDPDPAKNPIGSLGCTAATVVAGDVSKWGFADGVHLTPFGYELIADLVTDALRKKGWL